VERLKAMPARHKLVILVSDPTTQHRDDQFGVESAALNGGLFTNILLHVLQGIGPDTGDSMDQLATEVSTQIALVSRGTRKQPKLVTVPGADQIIWTRPGRPFSHPGLSRSA
jgi:hypothetical protein